MEAIVITAAVRTAMWATLLFVASRKRYAVFALMGLLGVVANVALGLVALDAHHAATWLEISGSLGVILIAVVVLKAFEGMRLRDKTLHPLSAEDLHLK